MKTIVLYGSRNPCWMVLGLLVAKRFRVKVITDDNNVKWLASMLGCELIDGFENMGKWDLFLSVHGWKIVPMKHLKNKIAINIHPCLFKYKGKDPIAKYIKNCDQKGSVGAHVMTDIVDEGSVICEIFFDTPWCNTHQDFYNIAYIYYLEVVSFVLNKVL